MSDTDAIWALGAMSGTSLDGVDAAMLLTDGHRVLEFGKTAYRPYSEAERATLRAALGHWDGAELAAAAEVVEDAHADLLSGFDAVDVVGFHGQTTHHDPAARLTSQAGNGALLAEALGRTVVWDFRTSDVTLGGQGAPLAPFYHFALAKYLGLREPVVFLNIGGVANVNWVVPTRPAPKLPGLAWPSTPDRGTPRSTTS